MNKKGKVNYTGSIKSKLQEYLKVNPVPKYIYMNWDYFDALAEFAERNDHRIFAEMEGAGTVYGMKICIDITEPTCHFK
jgi:hypothetical protein